MILAAEVAVVGLPKVNPREEVVAVPPRLNPVEEVVVVPRENPVVDVVAGVLPKDESVKPKLGADVVVAGSEKPLLLVVVAKEVPKLNVGAAVVVPLRLNPLAVDAGLAKLKVVAPVAAGVVAGFAAPKVSLLLVPPKLNPEPIELGVPKPVLIVVGVTPTPVLGVVPTLKLKLGVAGNVPKVGAAVVAGVPKVVI